MAKAQTASAKPRTAKAARMIDIVYVGPTLPADEVRALLPEADVRGPVAVGDVLRVVDEHRAKRARVGRIAIIDGYFERMAAVWHKEILLALEAGIEVWGAASMGALRAAELAPFGMRGVGTIFERFASGELVADDEVAVAHLPAEFAYRATSVALVDLRERIERALTGRGMRDAVKERLIELARAPFYRDRSWERLVADAVTAGMSTNVIGALKDVASSTGSGASGKTAAKGMATSTGAPSRKSADARLLLEVMARAKRTRPKMLRVPRTWALGQLRSTLGKP